jgi:hypothetical protein
MPEPEHKKRGSGSFSLVIPRWFVPEPETEPFNVAQQKLLLKKRTTKNSVNWSSWTCAFTCGLATRLKLFQRPIQQEIYLPCSPYVFYNTFISCFMAGAELNKA